MTRKLILLLLVALLAACEGTPPTPTATPTETPAPTQTPTHTPPPMPTSLPSVLELTRADDPTHQAFVRVVHAAPNLPTLDVFIERLAIGTNMSFTHYTEPTAIVAGEYFLRVTHQGGRPDNAESVLFETQISIQGQDSLMLMFTGNPEGIIMSTYPESTEPLDRNQSRITAIHAVERGPAFALQQDVVTLTSDLVYGEASNTITLESSETALNFQSGPNTLASYTEPLAPRTAYTLILTGQPENLDELVIIPIRTAVPGKITLRAINASVEMNNLDVYLNGQLFAGELQYPRASVREGLITDNYQVDVYPAGANPAESAPITSGSIFGADDDDYTVVFTGPIDDFRIISYRDDLSETPAGQARIAFLNPLNYINQVRMETAYGPINELGAMRYGDTPYPIHMSAGPHVYLWIAGSTPEETQLVESTDEVHLEQGINYLHILSGQTGNPPIFISENVGFQSASTDEENAFISDPLLDVTPAPAHPTRIRFINAVVQSQPLDFLIDDQPFATALEYGQQLDYIEAPSDEHLAEVRLSGSAFSLGQTLIALEDGQAYTLIAYGSGTEFAGLLLLDDAVITQHESDAPLLRLVNVTIGGAIRFGMAQSSASTEETFSPFSVAPQPQAQPITEEGQEATPLIYRRSVAYGIQTMNAIQPTDSLNSSLGLMPLGAYDLHLLDVTGSPTTIAGSFRQVTFEPNTLYDIIAYQERDSTLVHAFVVTQALNQP